MIWLLDNGHGKETPGKCSPPWEDLSQLFEWEFARDLVRRIIRAGAGRLNLVELVPEETDVPLRERCDRVYRWSKAGETALLSMHANAGGGEGFEIYTTPGFTKADKIATTVFRRLEIAFPSCRMRSDYSDGDPDKEANFYLLNHTVCPAVLCENLFMDNWKDCSLLLAPQFRERLAAAYIQAMIDFEL